MKRALGLIALAGAGAGFLLCTDQGRRLLQQAKEGVAQCRERLGEYLGEYRDARRAGDVEHVVESTLAKPHADTAMAHAFEEAVA